MEGFTIIVVIAVLVGVFLAAGYVKSPPDVAYIISGLKKEPKILIGKAGIRIPFFERKDMLLCKQITVDIKTNGYIPTRDFIGVDIDAVAKVRIMTDREGIKLAMKNFLNMREERICAALTDSLQGNMREIIGTVELRELCTDRKKFGDEVQTKAQMDMNALGIEIISCNIQKIDDEKGLIPALGQDNMSKIQKDASIAKAQADRDVAIAEAEAKKAANDAQVAAQTAISERQNELAIKQAELKKESDTRKAIADAAYEIQKEEQRKTIEITSANANIARQEREIELKQKEVQVTEQQLEAEIKKKAEAEKYAVQQKSEADLFSRMKKAEAEKFEQEQKAAAEKYEAECKAEAQKALANAIKAQGLAEAEAAKAKGEAEAAAIKAKAEAEAEGLMKKAEAMAAYGDAAKQEMQLKALEVYFQQLPSIAKAIGDGYQSVDKILMFGGETSNLAGDIMKNFTLLNEGVSESIGIDLKSLLAGFVGGKFSGNITAPQAAPVNINVGKDATVEETK